MIRGEHDVTLLNLLLEMQSRCARLRDADSLFRLLAERMAGILDWPRFTIVLCDHDRQIVRIVVIDERSVRDVPEIEIPAVDMEGIRRVLATAISSSDVTGLCSPMGSDAQLLGVFCCAARDEPYSAHERRFGDLFAEYLGRTFARFARTKSALRQAEALSRALAERETAIATAHALSEHIPQLAQRDVLTHLPNRWLLSDRLGRAIAFAQRHSTRLAVLFVDLDRFKQMNATLGPAIGDRVLRAISDRLAACVRSSDTVSRHGGDEFVVLCAELERAEAAAISATKILTAVADPLDIAGHRIQVTASIGLSIYPDDAVDGELLIQSADTAMSHAKAAGGNRYSFFTPTMNARAIERQFIEEGLQLALQRREFVLHYQPKVDLATGAVNGAEALIRWKHPDRGFMPPARFVAAAEDSGLIVPIGQWTLHDACRQTRLWHDTGFPHFSVAVNLSAVEFRSRTFFEDVRRILVETGLPEGSLELELTERVLVEHSETNLEILQALKGLGVKLAIDDFGTGYSSLSYLSQLPIDALKIDQSFVRQVVPDAHGGYKSRAAVIVGAVIGMGGTLGHRVIAEGVETRQQLAFLRSQRCSEGQGFLFSGPLDAERFAKVVEQRRLSVD